MQNLLTINDLTKIFGFSREKVTKLVNSHGFPKIKIGKEYRISEEELDKWIKKYSYNIYKM